MGGRKCFSLSPSFVSLHSYPVMLNSFPNKLYYYFPIKNKEQKKNKREQVATNPRTHIPADENVNKFQLKQVIT
jgi:hypothetical protein